MKNASIGIFDSGLGGLTVMRAIKDLLPDENIVYFGDTLHLPYGNKSEQTILRYSLENVQFLQNLGIKLLIIACHTVSTTAYQTIKKASSIPILEMVEPSIDLLKRYCQEKKNSPQITILGTKRTIDSNVYQTRLLSNIPFANIKAISCPLFVPLVEEGYIQHPIAKTIIQEQLKEMNGVDFALLACTHYPLLQSQIQETLGPSTILIDPAIACAQAAFDFLKKEDLLNPSGKKGEYAFYVSDHPEKFRLMGEEFLNCPVEPIFSTKIPSALSV